MDEVFINVRRERHYLWSAIGQNGDVIDILVQKRRDEKEAKRFFKWLVTSNQGVKPWEIVTENSAVIMLLQGVCSKISSPQQQVSQQSV
ncbi:DDE-type integrase/transposase/recombinase [Vibrio sp. DW001]|uniref:DDE-type integrase/transposase/recombinase n=1 Tax=Vibrio sp. DW001 TaxID=2912315 RepID=UPI0023B01D8D|nr:DDE-type integrase/transposase/recombinase [Vibrio sp. DW001]WED28740.1 DDE-type integrase/transposase/recombinase [Vibrio sp. DW001]